MSYTAIKNQIKSIDYSKNSLEGAALEFIRECCEGVRFSEEITQKEKEENKFFGTSIKAGQIPYNMQMDIDRLCLEKALTRFLKSGKKEDAFDVYFCYLEMFVGNYGEVRRMIELLSEFEANGSGLLMKHRDHYSHSVYVFALGLAIYHSNSVFRNAYSEYYGFSAERENEAACHYLEYWGMASLFHDIGYPFEQVCSYFEVNRIKRKDCPYIVYRNLGDFIDLNGRVLSDINKIYPANNFLTVNELYAHILTEKLGSTYSFDEEKMLAFLNEKPIKPDKFGHYMDHAYFSSVVLFKELFEEIGCDLKKEHLDALTAILMHNSLYKFCIANYKSEGNIPFAMNLHPLAYMLMLCDELQCWDRIAYGRNSKLELHPMDCEFDLSDNSIKAVYIYDEKESAKIKNFECQYRQWTADKNGDAPKLKAYSGMYIKDNNGVSDFWSDIKKIVDLSGIKISTEISIRSYSRSGSINYLSGSNFLNLYNFAVVLNGRWSSSEWRKALAEGREEEYLSDKKVIKEFTDSFSRLSLEYKLSNINQAKAFAGYMDKIGCFYTDKQVDFEMVEKFTDSELVVIGISEHKRWLTEHYDMGWEYGEPEKSERDLLRCHKDMIPEFDISQGTVTDEQAKANYIRLDKAEKNKDTEPMECMLAMLRMFDGLRIYRLN